MNDKIEVTEWFDKRQEDIVDFAQESEVNGWRRGNPIAQSIDDWDKAFLTFCAENDRKKTDASMAPANRREQPEHILDDLPDAQQ